MSGEVYGASFYAAQSAGSLSSARVVLERVFAMLRPRRVLDVGCGTGSWLRAAIDLGASDVLGTDGAYVDTDALLIDRNRFVPGDLEHCSVADILGERAQPPFDLVICAEVAEHLSHRRGPSLIAELAALGDVVLFSAAVPFQFGTGHVNEQWPEYWSILFRGQHFECFDPLRAALWHHPEVDWWYAQNALLFARRGTAAFDLLPPDSRVGERGLSLVHPDNVLANLLGIPRRHRLDASGEEVADLHALIDAYRRGAETPPRLAAPARAEAEGPAADRVFPATRTAVWDPEREIADRAEEAARLARSLGETGQYLQVANEAVDAERQARAAAMREADRLRDRLQAQAAARLAVELRLEEREREPRPPAEPIRAGSAEHDAEFDERRRELDARADELDALGAALAQRGAELEAASSAIATSRPRPGLRAIGRVRSVGRRLSNRFHPAPKAPETPPEPPPPEPTATPESADTSAIGSDESPPAKLPIKRYDEIVGEVNWWTLAAAITRLKRFEVFDPDDYLRRNPDVAAYGMDPYAHFLQAGALEDRGQVNPEDVARVMSGLALFDHAARAIPPEAQDDADLPDLVRDVAHIGIFVSTHGNVFMEDVAEDLASDLRDAGVRVDLLDETSDVDARPPTCLFVAPHEFFALGNGTGWIRDDVLSEGFMLSTEQVQTTWFQLSLPFILMSRGVIDICTQTASLFERLDLATLHVLPGARSKPRPLDDRDRRHPLYGVLPRAAQGAIDPAVGFRDRPIDMTFFGTSSPRRDRFFARNAAFFADYDTFNYNRRPGRGPIRGDGEDGSLTRLAGHVSGHSKITLNIHREEFGYFEWHRMVRAGMCAGSLVVSDPCLPHPDFVANEHYLQEDLRHMPNLLEWLLRTEDGAREAERVRANVDRLIGASFGTRHTAARILRFLAQHRSRERG